jgi:hypothetical protein
MLCKLIESLVVNNFPLKIVLAAFSESDTVMRVFKTNQAIQKDKTRKGLSVAHVQL